MIFHWAKKISTTQTHHHLALLLNKLFTIDISGPDCYTYEKFHIIWEAIRCYSFVESSNIIYTKKEDKILVNISKDLYNGLGQFCVDNDKKIYVKNNMSIFMIIMTFQIC
jgi:hypothetical protein